VRPPDLGPTPRQLGYYPLTRVKRERIRARRRMC